MPTHNRTVILKKVQAGFHASANIERDRNFNQSAVQTEINGFAFAVAQSDFTLTLHFTGTRRKRRFSCSMVPCVTANESRQVRSINRVIHKERGARFKSPGDRAGTLIIAGHNDRRHAIKLPDMPGLF